jgi:MoxR-like ATPase
VPASARPNVGGHSDDREVGDNATEAHRQTRSNELVPFVEVDEDAVPIALVALHCPVTSALPFLPHQVQERLRGVHPPDFCALGAANLAERGRKKRPVLGVVVEHDEAPTACPRCQTWRLRRHDLAHLREGLLGHLEQGRGMRPPDDLDVQLVQRGKTGEPARVRRHRRPGLLQGLKPHVGGKPGSEPERVKGETKLPNAAVSILLPVAHRTPPGRDRCNLSYARKGYSVVVNNPTEGVQMSRKIRPQPPGVLHSLGLFGYESVEWPILCGLVTGDPILLVGGHGTAKTTLGRRVARALGKNFWAYDASKALFEDVLGFPNPASLDGGKLEYISTPISIWGREFVLVDEISRANPAMQSKWLELIRGRQVMGMPIEGLQYVMAAMNPPSYLGAYPLDEALAGRFAIVVEVPNTDEMADEFQERIVRSVASEDAPMCSEALRGTVEEVVGQREASEQLAELLDLARAAVGDIDEPTRKRYSAYVLEVAGFCSAHQRRLDGRRLGMLWRNFMAAHALWQASHGAPPEGVTLERLFYRVLRGSMPFVATEDKEPGELLYRSAHEAGLRALLGESGRRFKLPRDPWDAAEVWIDSARELNSDQLGLAVTWFGEQLQSPSPRTRLRAGAGLVRMGSLAHHQDVSLRASDRHRLLEQIRAATSIKSEVRDDHDLHEAVDGLMSAGLFDAGQTDHVLGLRLVLAAQTDRQQDDVSWKAGPVRDLFGEALRLLAEAREDSHED